MDEVFIDTAGWAVLFVRTEPQHAQASESFRRWKRQGRRLVTTNYVLAELVSLFTSPLRVPRPAQFRYIDAIKTAPICRNRPRGPLTGRGRLGPAEIEARQGLVIGGAVSFIVMQKRGIVEALTTDHHFEQAGFMRLLKLLKP